MTQRPEAWIVDLETRLGTAERRAEYEARRAEDEARRANEMHSRLQAALAELEQLKKSRS